MIKLRPVTLLPPTLFPEMQRKRDIILQKRAPSDILPPVREDIGEPPILDEIYSQTRSAQNRQHSLALDIKRMNRVYDRVWRSRQRSRQLIKSARDSNRKLRACESRLKR
jgi:hypothetical protein